MKKEVYEARGGLWFFGFFAHRQFLILLCFFVFLVERVGAENIPRLKVFAELEAENRRVNNAFFIAMDVVSINDTASHIEAGSAGIDSVHLLLANNSDLTRGIFVPRQIDGSLPTRRHNNVKVFLMQGMGNFRIGQFATYTNIPPVVNMNYSWCFSRINNINPYRWLLSYCEWLISSQGQRKNPWPRIISSSFQLVFHNIQLAVHSLPLLIGVATIEGSYKDKGYITPKHPLSALVFCRELALTATGICIVVFACYSLAGGFNIDFWKESCIGIPILAFGIFLFLHGVNWIFFLPYE